MANIIGPDISFYEDDPQTPQSIDFAKMRQSAEFVIVRAGQNLWVDRDFKLNWRLSKEAGVPRGSYWFYDSRADPKRQAELWASQFGGNFGELPLFADFEEKYGGSYKGWRNWYDFLERLKQLIGKKEIAIYTGYYYWRDNAPNATTHAKELEYFHQYPLWIAHYGAVKPSVPKPWGADEWTFWQYTESGDGKLYGTESKGVDLNYFNGDLDAFRARFNLSDAPPPPPPPPPPTDPGVPTGKMYKVTAQPSLRVREGPGTGYTSIGSLYTNEVVEEIGATADRTWLRIRRADNSLVGWSSAPYLQLVSSPPPPPPPVGQKLLRVITTALNVRQGAGTSYSVLGQVYFGETVEELGANADRSWLNIRKLDGSLTGWSSAAYLVSASSTLPPAPSDLTPIAPADRDKHWYRVGIAPLPVRASPSASADILGSLALDDTIPALDDSNSTWIQIRRLDGLTGWCEKKNLVYLSNARPASVRQNLFPGVTYLYKDLTTPRANRMHVMAVDLQTIGLEFLVTPCSNTDNVMCARTPSQFLKEFGLQFAINGDGFIYLDTTQYPPAKYCPNGGDPVRPNGYAASRGKVYSSKKTAQPIVYLNSKNQVAINGVQSTVFNAVSGDRVVVQDGVMVKNLADAVPNPRTAIGLNKTGRWLIFMVIDGRETGASEGMTFPELAQQLISYGVYTGVNMDGGGSSAMVIRGIDGNPRLLSTPIDQNITGKERSVANHVGLFVKK